VVVMLPLSAFVHACPTVHLGSPRLCSPTLVHASPAVHWVVPIHAHWPSFMLVPPFVWAAPVCARLAFVHASLGSFALPSFSFVSVSNIWLVLTY
jgi:hypothetical protein